MRVPSVITTVIALNWLSLRSEGANGTEDQFLCVYTNIRAVPSVENVRAAARLDHL